MASPMMGGAINQFGKQGEMSRYWESGKRPATHGMIGLSIDDFIETFNPPFPNHVKLDVDGLELNILKGARVTLRDERIRSLIVEISVSQENDFGVALSQLEEAGFRFVSKGAIQGTSADSAANHLFERTYVPSAIDNSSLRDLDAVSSLRR